MERSIASLSSGRNTREPSPTRSETSRILTNLESQTSALGHVGIIKWQRNELKKQLLQQKDLTVQEQQNAANFRRLALRLAAQIAVKEARLKSHAEALSKSRGLEYVNSRRKDGAIKDLETKLQDDLSQANALLRTMGGSDSVARYDGLGFHVASRPLSPPLSPFDGRSSFTRSAKAQTGFRQLPSEILQLCQIRAGALLRESSEYQQSIHLLQQSQLLLQKKIGEKDTEIASLQVAKAEIEKMLEVSKNEIDSLKLDLRQSNSKIETLEREKIHLQEKAESLTSHIQELNGSLETDRLELESVQTQLGHNQREFNDISTQLSQARMKISDLEATKSSLEANLQALQTELSASALMSGERLVQISNLKSDIQSHRNEVDILRQRKQDLEVKSKSLRQELDKSNQALVEKQDVLSDVNQNLHTVNETLKTTILNLESEKTRCQSLSIRQEDLNRLLSGYEKQTAEMNQTLASTTKALESTREQVTELWQIKTQMEKDASLSMSSISKYEETENKLRVQLRNLEESLVQQQSSISALEAELDRSQNAKTISFGQVADLRKELASANEKLLQTQTNYTERSFALETAEKSHAALSSRILEVNSVHSETLKELERKNGEYEAEKVKGDSIQHLLAQAQANYETSKSEISTLRQAMTSLHQKLELTQAEKANLEKDLANEARVIRKLREDLCTAEDVQGTLSEEMDSLRRLSQNAATEMEQLRASLAEAIGSRDLYQLASDSSEDKAQNLESQLSALGAKIAEFQDRERDTLEASKTNRQIISGLERQLAQGQESNSQIQRKLDEASATIYKHQESKTRLEAELLVAIKELREVRNINHTLREEIEKAQREFSGLKRENQDLSEKLKIADSTNAKLDSENTRQAKELEEHAQRSQAERVTLQTKLSVSEDAIIKLQRDIKSLSDSSREVESQLRRSQAIRASHENALGALRVRLGASKMAKRGVELKLSQAEREYAGLQKHNEKIEASLSIALAEVVGGQEIQEEQRQRISQLQGKHDRLAEKLTVSEETVNTLRETIHQFELQSKDFKEETSRLRSVVDQAETEIASLKDQIIQLNEQHKKDVTELAGKERQIGELQNAKTMLETSLEEKVALAKAQQAEIAEMKDTQADDKMTIAYLDAEKADLMRLTNSLRTEVNTKDVMLGEQQRRAMQLESGIEVANRRAKDLTTRLEGQTKQASILQAQNDQYAKELASLRTEVRSLETSRAALEEQLKAFQSPAEPDLEAGQQSSPTLVTDELEFPQGEEDNLTFESSSRPMSPTRVGTGHSSIKAFRVLGAEAAAGRPGFEEDEVKKQLWDLWSSQHRLGPVQEEAQAGEGMQAEVSTAEAPRIRRKLTKKRRVEQLKTEDTGKFYNLLHYGSMSRPALDKPLKSSRSLFLRN